MKQTALFFTVLILLLLLNGIYVEHCFSAEHYLGFQLNTEMNIKVLDFLMRNYIKQQMLNWSLFTRFNFLPGISHTIKFDNRFQIDQSLCFSVPNYYTPLKKNEYFDFFSIGVGATYTSYFTLFFGGKNWQIFFSFAGQKLSFIYNFYTVFFFKQNFMGGYFLRSFWLYYGPMQRFGIDLYPGKSRRVLLSITMLEIGVIFPLNFFQTAWMMFYYADISISSGISIKFLLNP